MPDEVKQEIRYILYTDQAEYYFVCTRCFREGAAMQWSGGTRGGLNWRERSRVALRKHQEAGKDCQWCGIENGGGGWRGTSALERRDKYRLQANWTPIYYCKEHGVIQDKDVNADPDTGDVAVNCPHGDGLAWLAWRRPDGTIKHG